MVTAEEDPNTDIIFRGMDGSECEAFVVAVRDIAFAKGKDEDPNWTLRYATTRLRGKALRWHAKLEPSIRKDWDLFVQAIFEEYPFVEEHDGDGTTTPEWASTTFSPTPSTVTLPSNYYEPPGSIITPHPGAETDGDTGSRSTDPTPLEVGQVARPRVYDPSLLGEHTGRLLVISEEGPQGFRYISASSKCATSSTDEALIVSFVPSSEPHQITCINGGEPRLGIRLCNPQGLFLQGFYLLIETRSTKASVTGHLGKYEDISNIWSISTDGTLNAKLPYLLPASENTGCKTGSDFYSTNTVYVDTSGATVSFVKDDGTPLTMNPRLGLPILRARIVFEPV